MSRKAMYLKTVERDCIVVLDHTEGLEHRTELECFTLTELATRDAGVRAEINKEHEGCKCFKCVGRAIKAHTPDTAAHDADTRKEERAKVLEAFGYVEITSPGCEGWINLFFGEYPIALIDSEKVAAEIKAIIQPLAQDKE